MADESLKDFLRQQARSLDSLLELTPAKNMFGEDVSDQWKRRKQTPEQKKAARKAKLDPANWKSAKDVYDERAAQATKKRKREEGKQHDETNTSVHESSQNGGEFSSKKRRIDTDAKPKKAAPTEKIAEVGDVKAQNLNLKKRAKKRASRKARNEQTRQKLEAKKTREANQPAGDESKKAKKSKSKSQTEGEDISREVKQEEPTQRTSKLPSSKKSKHESQDSQSLPTRVKEQAVAKEDSDWSDVEEHAEEQAGEIGQGADAVEGESSEDEKMEDAESTATSSEGIPDILSPPQDSAASSVSSIIPPPTEIVKAELLLPNVDIPKHKHEKPHLPPVQETTTADKVVLSEAERLAARQRLQEQIDSFRSQRKADDKTPRSRAELLDQRRRKEEERKAAKKAQRQKEKEEEAIRQDQEMARRFSPGGSGSLLGSPRSPLIDTGSSSGGGYSYGRIAFEDGTSLDPNTLSDMKEKRHKGPQDTATALKAAQAKQVRLAGLDETKRADIAEKDMWLNAKKRAHGEKIRDDQSLLKKALKRQEKQKSRSGTEWDDRIEGVRSAQEAKQKKRTENIQKRKDEKFAKKSGASKKKVKRPGFEGSFRGRTGKGKK